MLLGNRVNAARPVSAGLRFKFGGDSVLMVKSGGVSTFNEKEVGSAKAPTVAVMVTVEAATGVEVRVGMVTLMLAVMPAATVGAAGEKLQGPAPAGSPEHAKLKSSEPDTAVEAVTVKLVVADAPAGVVALAAVPMLKGVTELRVNGNC